MVAILFQFPISAAFSVSRNSEKTQELTQVREERSHRFARPRSVSTQTEEKDLLDWLGERQGKHDSATASKRRPSRGNPEGKNRKRLGVFSNMV
jgi:hypothetical protein